MRDVYVFVDRASRAYHDLAMTVRFTALDPTTMEVTFKRVKAMEEYIGTCTGRILGEKPRAATSPAPFMTTVKFTAGEFTADLLAVRQTCPIRR